VEVVAAVTTSVVVACREVILVDVVVFWVVDVLVVEMVDSDASVASTNVVERRVVVDCSVEVVEVVDVVEVVVDIVVVMDVTVSLPAGAVTFRRTFVQRRP